MYNQALEIDILSGFCPNKDPHLLWAAKSHLKGATKRFKYFANERVAAEDPVEVANYSEKVQFELGLMTGLQSLLSMLSDEVFPHWYCARCGYLNSEDVSFDERCNKCGGTLPV